MDPTDRQLLLDTHRGREAAARLLWSRHAPRLLAHARAIVRDPAAAEDVVQSVMCRLLELPRSRLAAIDDVPAFLCTSTRRQALNHIRAARRENARRAALDAPPRSAQPPSSRAPDLDGALDALPRRLREIVVLKHVSGLTFDQIALALATNRSTIAGRYRTALALLKDILNPAAPATSGAAHA